MKTYKLGDVKMVMENNGYIKGFPLKRELDYREAKLFWMPYSVSIY